MTELERISGLEAQTDGRPIPKHDVLTIMTYLKTKLPSNPIDELVRVEPPNGGRDQYAQAIQEWIDAVLDARDLKTLKQEGKEALSRLKKIIEKEVNSINGDFHGQQPANAVGQESLLEKEATIEDEDELDEMLLKADKLFVTPPLWYPPHLRPVQVPLASSTSRRKSNAVPSAPASVPPPLPPVNPIELPLPIYLNELASRLAKFFEKAFESTVTHAEMTSARKVVTWSPADREEDDVITALGLARDPTKITSRVVVGSGDGGEVTRHWIACETPAGIINGSGDAACEQGLISIWLSESC